MKIFIKTIFAKSLGIYLLGILINFLPAQLQAQGSDSKGTDFWLMFNANLATPTLTVFIASDVNTSGTVAVPGLAFSAPFVVAANSVTSVVVPVATGTHTNSVVDNKGIHVTALNEVTVYGLNYAQFTTDAYLGLPTDVLGTDYIIMSYPGNTLSEFGIVASANATAVTITQSVTGGGHLAGVPYVVNLNQGQTVEISGGTDYTGTLITSNNPIGVMGANACANIPPGFGFCDHINEMLPPTTTWGKKFGSVPLKNRINGDSWRFMASENATVVSINGVPQVPTLNKGQFLERVLTTQAVIESDKPILAAQFANGSGFSGNPGDPFMMLVPPLEQFLAKYTVTTVSGYVAHFINVVAPNSIVGTVMLDGVPISPAAFTPIGASGFSGAQLTVSAGIHNLLGTLPFGVFMYGFNTDDSYGYPGGQAFGAVASVTTLTLTPETGTAPVNNERCFDALVKDQFDNPVAGVRVDFTITGANPGSTGFAFTDVNGVAHFCYTGLIAGADVITASVGTISDVSNFTWTDGCNITVTAKKFYDLNTNGLDDDNLPVQGWSITLSGTDENANPVGPINQLTGVDGQTAFTPLAKGEYTVTEGNVAGWINTTPTSASLSLTTCVSPPTVRFGNVCLGSGSTGGNGGGLGYWTNKNGQSHITGGYLCELNTLCLRNADGSNFDPITGCPAPSNGQVNTGKTSLKNWLLNATATNMAYMLSAQLAAVKLNVLNGYLDATRLIYAPGTLSANAAGFATLNAVMAEANTLLCANPLINAGNILRTRAEALKNALEAASGNSNFVQLQPCTITTPTAPTTTRSQEIITNQLSVRENAVILLKASPNPSKDFFTVTLVSDNKIERINVRILDMQGRLIESQNGLKSGQTIQVGNTLRPGTYLIEMVQGRDRKTQAVIKQ